MTPFTIASTVNPDTRVMTVHYDGCEIRLEPIVVGIDVLVDRHLDFKILINNETIKQAKFETLCEFTFQGKSSINTIRFEQAASQPKERAFEANKAGQLDFKYSDVFFAINGVTVRHTMHDPMDKIQDSLNSLKILLGFNILIMAVLAFQGSLIDVFIYSFIISMTYIAILSFRRYHFFGLVFGASICSIEVLLFALGLILSTTFSTSLLLAIAIGLKLRVVLLYNVFTGIRSAWKVKKFNERLHLELSNKATLL